MLAPAGSPEALDAAIGEGADAVYLGLKDFNARMRSVNFTYAQFEGALRSLHRMGKKLYVTVNTVFEQREADRVYQLLKYLAAQGPDGIMVQDFGIITMARDNFPSLRLFSSTQMNVASARGVNLLSRYGFSRAVLARELSLAEIREIRANTNMELEVFVHGALCMSVSGICLFSSYLGGKSANRGMCTQACRRLYKADGEESGGYYFSPADLELIDKVPDLVNAGVNSFKIEGRMKSAEYVGAVVSAYRMVMDNLEAGEEILRGVMKEARGILKNDFARSKTVYLINGLGDGYDVSAGIPVNTEIDWLNPRQNGGTGIPLGKLLRVKGEGEERRGLVPPGIAVPAAGDSIRLHRADDSERLSHKLKFAEEGEDGYLWISIPEGFEPGDAVYLIQTRAMTKRYAPVLRGAESGRGPGHEKAPPPKAEWVRGREEISRAGEKKTTPKTPPAKGGSRRGEAADFPEGFYAMVSRIEDLYVLQSQRPVKAILPYSRKLLKQLLGREALPFPARDTIISLDPFFSEEREAQLSEDIPALLERGYTGFIVNNPGHFSLFRRGASSSGLGGGSRPEEAGKSEKGKAVLAAGPWLYTYNAWAWAFLSKCGADYCVSPLENNRQNLERTFSPADSFSGKRSQVFITIFAWPSLFRIRRDLRAFYNFKNFAGSRDEEFRMTEGPEGTLVYPREPFSIVDKTPFLREAGFSRFILDFSPGPLKKAEYREIMDAANKAVPLSGANRFNWKNGFYREPG